MYDLTFSFVLFTGAVYQMCKLLNLLFDFPANMLRCIQRASLKYTNAKCKQMNSHQAVFDCSNLLNVLRCNVRAQVFPKIYREVFLTGPTQKSSKYGTGLPQQEKMTKYTGPTQDLLTQKSMELVLLNRKKWLSQGGFN